jgi:hypothetical protein
MTWIAGATTADPAVGRGICPIWTVGTTRPDDVAENSGEMPTKSFAHYTAGTVLCCSQDVQRTSGLTTPAHEEAKEVAQMINNTIQMAAGIPSSFGMPICGHASKTTFAGVGTTTVVRDRQAVVTGDMGLAGYIPGTSAWRPPSS